MTEISTDDVPPVWDDRYDNPLPHRLPVGSRLTNGATVLRSVLVSERSDLATYVVLALSHDEFVTWRYECRPDGEAGAFNGDYHGGNLPAALEDYYERSADEREF